MACPSKRFGMSPWLKAFDDDERGTALTELIVTLPVFIIIFVGMVSLSKVEQQSVHVKIMASKDTWEQAMEVANGGLVPSFNQSTPMLAGMDGLSKISNYPSENGDMLGQMKNIGLATGGQAGEGDRATMFAGVWGQSPPGDAPGQSLSDYPQNMLDDEHSQFRTLSGASGPLAVYLPNIPLSALGSYQAIAASNRYGMVVGEADVNFTASGRNFDFAATYDVLNSPVSGPASEFYHDLIIVPGFSRLMAEEDDCLSNILALDRSMGYLSNCF
jgi:hypothetical protein